MLPATARSAGEGGDAQPGVSLSCLEGPYSSQLSARCSTQNHLLAMGLFYKRVRCASCRKVWGQGWQRATMALITQLPLHRQHLHTRFQIDVGSLCNVQSSKICNQV